MPGPEFAVRINDRKSSVEKREATRMVITQRNSNLAEICE